jgi:SAM-dependent methyltransferase
MAEHDNTGSPRSASQIRDHYEIERRLAHQLMSASKQERRTLYSSAYEELFRLVPHHPMLTRKTSAADRAADVGSQLRVLSRFLRADKAFLEVGPGDCALTFSVAPLVRHAFAVDVSPSITRADKIPPNVTMIISDGVSIPVPKGSIDVAYSNQLMEHLHPEDALEQLQNIFHSLASGGCYLCITPNRLNGPHDISRAFDMEASGFHLKEYTISELARLFKNAGFGRAYLLLGAKGHYRKMGIGLSKSCEKLLQLLPPKVRQKLASARILRQLIEVRLVGVKE